MDMKAAVTLESGSVEKKSCVSPRVAELKCQLKVYQSTLKLFEQKLKKIIKPIQLHILFFFHCGQSIQNLVFKNSAATRARTGLYTRGSGSSC